MKYWLLTTEYPPFYGGGISTYCYFTAKMMAEQGHHVSVFVNDASVQNFVVAEDKNIRLIRFNPARTESSSFLGHVTNISFEFAHAVKYFIDKEGKPDVIEAQEYLGIAYYLLQFKYLLYDWCKNIPVIITMHSPSFLYMKYNQISEYQYPNYWICEMERFCLQAADLVISPSVYILEELKNHFELTQHNIEIIPNPFLSRPNTTPVNESIENEIVFFGKLTAQKGAFQLLAYFKSLWDKGFNEPLYLIGGQDIVYHPENITMGDLIRKKYKYFLDKRLLRMEDRVPPENIAQRLSTAKVVIVPSNNDNLPYVVFEMMSLGKMVLASKQGGQAEIIDNGIDGFLFDHHQPETFEEKLLAILNLTPQQRRTIAANAQQKITAAYSPDSIYPKKIAALKATQQLKDRNIFPHIRALGTSSETCDFTFTKDLLSIVVPYFNMGKYIDATIQSLKNVFYPYKEIIIINDGSTEAESTFVLDRYRNRQDIQIIDLHNCGLAAARNYGAKIATGEFLAFLDADDLVERDYYTKAIQVLSRYNNVHFVGSWTRYFEGSSQVWPTFSPEPPIILYHNTINSSALIYKRNFFLQNGKNDKKMPFQGLEDYDSVISLLASGLRGAVLPEPLFKYRVRSNSMIRSVSKNKKLFLTEYIGKKYRVFYGTFAAEITSLLQANGPGFGIDNPTLDYSIYLKNPLLNKFVAEAVHIVKHNLFLKKIVLGIYKKFKS